MNFKDNEENRGWILGALDALAGFVRTDADFRGNKAYEQKAIGYQRQFVEDGKYRVVFLGTFNVGKSTAVNAFLGGGYLPMDVEECTSKLTFIQRGEDLQLRLRLSAAASDNERQALERVYRDIPASVTAADDGHTLYVSYGSREPKAMRLSLEPLVTVMADEEFPHLAPLRDKIDELNLSLPSSILAEDIVFVDTPGVHSVSETRQEISYGIIERSHLVINFVDSSFAGNIHDLNFIKRIIKWRGRHVFFVLNKADKLDADEIDIRGARGPVKSLLEAFKRHDIPENSEVFFLSGYRALRAQELEQDFIDLREVLDDNRISIPTSVMERIQSSDGAVRDLSAYLMGQSRFPYLKERLLQYLVNDNRAGTVMETAGRFIEERANDYVSSLENELNLAKDPTRFDELRANRDALLERLEEIRLHAQHVLNQYHLRARGGRVEGRDHKGYEGEFHEAMSEDAIQREVINPLLDWLRQGDNLKDARRDKFKTLGLQIEHQVDEFVSGVMARIGATIDTVESDTQTAVAQQLGQVRGLRMNLTQPGSFQAIPIEASMTGSYAAFGAGGAVIGAAAGAAVGSVVPILGTAIGAGLGGIIGAVGAFFARLAWSEDRWLKKLEPVIRENAMNMLVHGGKDKDGNRAPAIMETVLDYLRRRADAFQKALQDEIDNAIASVQRECDDLLSREQQIRAERNAIIQRLEPKVDLLHGLRARAESIVQDALARETLRV